MTGKLFKYIFVYLSAAYFLFAGLGYNVVKYCCNACEQKGIELVAETSCDCIHHHHHHKSHHHAGEEDVACDNLNHQSESCHLLRVKIDIAFELARISIPSVQQVHLFYLLPETLFKSSVVYTDTNFFPPPNSNLLATSGRSLLALHSVLLI